MTTGEKIKALRNQMGLTQTELGEKVGVQKNAVSKWECGRVDAIPTDTIKALASIFNVRPSYLIDEWEEDASSPATPAPVTDDEEPEIQLSDFTYAMHNYDGDLTDHDKEVLLGLARQLAESNRNKK